MSKNTFSYEIFIKITKYSSELIVSNDNYRWYNCIVIMLKKV